MVADRSWPSCVDGVGGMKNDMHFDDACIAVGVAVLDLLASGDEAVLVCPDGDGGWCITGCDIPSSSSLGSSS